MFILHLHVVLPAGPVSSKEKAATTHLSFEHTRNRMESQASAQQMQPK